MFKQIMIIAILGCGTPAYAAEPFDTIDQNTRIMTLFDAELQACGVYDTFEVAPEILKQQERVLGPLTQLEEAQIDGYISVPMDSKEVMAAFTRLNGDSLTVGQLKEFQARLLRVNSLKPTDPDCKSIEAEAMDAIIRYRAL